MYARAVGAHVSLAHQSSRHMVEHAREPCPHRIIDDIGGAFGMGAVGGGVWHLVKGLRNSPQGYRFRGAIEVRSFSTNIYNLSVSDRASFHAGDAKVKSDGPPPFI